jgi:hypothetical protein
MAGVVEVQIELMRLADCGHAGREIKLEVYEDFVGWDIESAQSVAKSAQRAGAEVVAPYRNGNRWSYALKPLAANDALGLIRKRHRIVQDVAAKNDRGNREVGFAEWAMVGAGFDHGHSKH